MIPINGKGVQAQCRSGNWTASWSDSVPAWNDCGDTTGGGNFTPTFTGTGQYRIEIRKKATPTAISKLDIYVHDSLNGSQRCPAYSRSEAQYFADATALINARDATHLTLSPQFITSPDQHFDAPFLNITVNAGLTFANQAGPTASMAAHGWGWKYGANFTFNRSFRFSNTGGYLAPLRHRFATDTTGKLLMIQRARRDHNNGSCQLKFDFDGAERTCDAYVMTKKGAGVCLSGGALGDGTAGSGTPSTASVTDLDYGWSAMSDRKMFGGKCYAGDCGGWASPGVSINIPNPGSSPP